MIEPNANTRDVMVTWKHTHAGQDRVNRVTLIEGYSDEASIPAILAIKELSGVKAAADIVIVSVEAVIEDDELDYDTAEAIGLDGTGMDGDPRFPHRISTLWPRELKRLEIHRAEGTEFEVVVLTHAEQRYLARAVDLGRSDDKARKILDPVQRDELLKRLGGRDTD